MDGLTIKKWYKEAQDKSQDWRKEAKEMYDLRAGWQWEKDEEAALKENMRVPVTMNRIGPYVDAIVGQQINNRQEVKYLPRETSDTSSSDILSEVARWVDDTCNAEDELTDSFEDMVICGMGWTETRMDFDEDPLGKLVSAERVDPFEMYWDCKARKRNLADASWIIRAVRYPKDAAEEKWPKLKKIEAEYASDEDDDSGEPHDATNAWKYANEVEYYKDAEEYLILQCQYYVDEQIFKVADPETNQLVDIPASKARKKNEAGATLLDMFDANGIRYMPAKKRKFFQSFVCGETELSKEEAPSQKGFTFKAMCARRDRNKHMWYGVVRSMKDPQKFSNKFFSDILYILATNRKGGVMVEHGAVTDMRRFKEDYANPAAVLELNDGALSNGRIKERDAGIYPTGLERLMNFSINAVPEVTGMSQELLGLAEKNQPGVLEQQRRQASLTILAPLFDAFRRHCKERGVVVLDMFQYIGDGRMIRVTSNGEQQSVPFKWSPEMGEFDVIVDTSSTSPNQKIETFNALQQLIPYMTKVGMPVPPDVMDYLPLPATLVEKWKAQMQPKEPSPEQQLQQKGMEAEVTKTMAEAEYTQAKAQSEGLKVQESQTKMEVEAQKAQHDILMSQIQAQQEEQKMQFEQVMKTMDIMLKKMEIEQRGVEMRHETAMAEQNRVQAVESHQMAMTQAKAKQNERRSSKPSQ